MVAHPLDPYQALKLVIHKNNWMTSNQRTHWAKNAEKSAALKQAAYIHARKNRLTPICEPVWVHALIGLPTMHRFDPPNAWPTIKPIIDGLVDAGVLQDDDSAHVPYTSFSRDPNKSPKDKYRITIYLVPESSEIYAPF